MGDITTAFVKQYDATIQLLVQQLTSRLGDKVRREPMTGERAFFDQLAKTSSQEKTDRYGDTPLIIMDHRRRSVTIRDFVWATLVEGQDKIRMLADPTNAMLRSAIAALYRDMDAEIIRAALGTAFTGKEGTTAVTFPSTQQIAVNFVESGSAANSNLTIGKLRQAKFLLDAAEVDPDTPRYLAHTASQMRALLRTTEVTSADYLDVNAFLTGKVPTILGFTPVSLELLPKTGNNRSCIAWSKNGLLMTDPGPVMTRLTERDDKNFAAQPYAKLTCGATRMQEEEVVEILCDETA